MSDNLRVYNLVRTVPPTAQKEIKGGRMNGKTDINPMWRLKALTEQFGMCGIGWKYEIVRQWIEEGGNGEKSAFCNINLYIKDDGKWSDGIPGTGGSSFIAQESKGLFTSDECFKMALTDAISVSCKALGFGADIYWEKDASKYDRPPSEPTTVGGSEPTKSNLSEAQVKRLIAIAIKKGYSAESVKNAVHKRHNLNNIADMTKTQYDECVSGYEGLPDKK